MVLEPKDATDFIQGYTKFMTAIYELSSPRVQQPVIEVIQEARGRYCADRTLLEKALIKLEAQSKTIDPEVLNAIRSLEVKKWVYLKDAKTYSVFIDPDGNAAYAVLGLTDRIREFAGATGMIFEAGLVRYKGRFVCDGIVASPIFLGQSYRKDFNAVLSRIKRQGNFHAKSNL